MDLEADVLALMILLLLPAFTTASALRTSNDEFEGCSTQSVEIIEKEYVVTNSPCVNVNGARIIKKCFNSCRGWKSESSPKYVCPIKNGSKPNYGLKKPSIVIEDEGSNQNVRRLSYREYFEISSYLPEIFEIFDLNNDTFSIGSICICSKTYYVRVNTKGKMQIDLFNNQTTKYLGIQMITNSEKLLLKFDSDSDSIYLTASQGLEVKCFTNAYNDTVTSVEIKDMNVVHKSQNETTYKMGLYGDDLRYYWCEAHYPSDGKFIPLLSEKITARKKLKHTFATFFEIPCDVKTCKEFRRNKTALETQVLEDLTSQEKFKDLKIHIKVQVMNHQSINNNLQKNISFLCHILVSLPNFDRDYRFNSNNYDEDYQGIEDIEVSMTLRDKLNDLLKSVNPNSSSVKSTQFCFREPFSNNSNSSNTWLTAVIGETSTTSELCLQSNLPITRRCVGDSLYGAMWENVESKQFLCEPNIKNELYEISRSKEAQKDPKKTVKYVKEIIRNNLNDLQAVDLFYLSKTVRTITTKVISMKSTNIHNDTETMIGDILSVYDNLMNVNVTVLEKSSTTGLNSTNILLEAFEKFVDEISMSTISQLTSTDNATQVMNEQNQTIKINDIQNGIVAWIAPKLVVFFIDPNFANVTGLAIYKSKIDKSNYNGIFEDNSNYKFLYSNQSARELLEEDNLELATFVPGTLLNRLEGHPRIVIKIFTNDRLFQEDPNIKNASVYNKIVSLSIPGYDRNLSELLPLVMRKPSGSNVIDDNCRYWNFETWATDGLEFLGTSTNNNNLVWCGTRHLTSFAYLIGEKDVPKFHRKALDIVTLIGCSLSLVGIMGILITALVFRKWRQMDTSKILLQLSLAIALQMILFCIVSSDYLIANKIYWRCVALGAGLHYSVLVQFSWMMIIAYPQYKRYVKALPPHFSKQFFIKSFFIGWVVPLIPVLLVVFLDRQSYIPWHGNSESAICYPSGKSLYFGICLPVALVIFGNLVIYLLVICNLISAWNPPIRRHYKRMPIREIKTSVFLFFSLGLTWIFGLLAAIKAGIVFSYLFSITATFQGFTMFVYLIVLDPATSKMWIIHFAKK